MERTVTVQTKFSTGGSGLSLKKPTFDLHAFPAALLKCYSSYVRKEHTLDIPKLGFKVCVPNYSRDHLFVMYPIVERDGSHEQMVYAIKLCEGECLSRRGILSRLRDCFRLDVGDDDENCLLPEDIPGGSQRGDGYSYGSGSLLCYSSGDGADSNSQSTASLPILFPSSSSSTVAHDDRKHFNRSRPSPEVSPPSNASSGGRCVPGTDHGGLQPQVQPNGVPCRKVDPTTLPHLLQHQQATFPGQIREGFNPAYEAKTKEHKIESPSVPYELRLITAGEKNSTTEIPLRDIGHPSDDPPTIIVPKVRVISPKEVSPLNLAPSDSDPATDASKQEMCAPNFPASFKAGLMVTGSDHQPITRASSMTFGDRKSAINGLKAELLHQRSVSDPTLNQPAESLRQTHLDLKRLDFPSRPTPQETASASPRKDVVESSERMLKVEAATTPKRRFSTSCLPAFPLQIQISNEGEQVITGRGMRGVGDRFKSGLLPSPTKGGPTVPPKVASTQHSSQTAPSAQGESSASGYRASDNSESTRDSVEPEASVVGEEVIQQVHLMEHAINGKCWKPYCSDQFDAERIRQMKACVSILPKEIKDYIRTHCGWCTDRACAIPHRAAGCPPPGDKSTPVVPPTLPSTREFTPLLSNAQGINDLSYDPVPANLSTTEDVQQATQPFEQISLPCPDHTPPRPPPQQQQQQQQQQYRLEQTDGTQPDIVTGPPLQGHRTPPPPHGMGVIDSPTFAQKKFPMTNRGAFQYPAQYHAPGNRLRLELNGAHNQHGPQQPSRDEGSPQKVLAYLRHDQDANTRLRQQAYAGHTTTGLVDVTTEGFPPRDVYAREKPGTVIYCSDGARRVLIQGSVLPIPAIQAPAELGRGGNGTVFRHFFYNQEFAIKMTSYRKTELETWRALEHSSIVPLLAVMCGHGNKCFQLMPCMQNDLSQLMRQCGPLLKLYQETDPTTYEEVVLPNVLCVIKKILSGVDYLHCHQLQHTDLKASNILITSHCPSQRHAFPLCSCVPLEERYEVRIADFDSIKPARNPHHPSAVPRVDTELKTPEEQAKVMGTPGYRAPEQFFKPMDGSILWSSSQEQEGTWCDIVSLGNIILALCLGPNTEEDRKSAWCLHGQPNKTQFSKKDMVYVECTHAREKLIRLFDHVGKNPSRGNNQCHGNDPVPGNRPVCPTLYKIARLAKSCLEPDLRKRPTAKELLCNGLFTSPLSPPSPPSPPSH